MKEPAPKGWPWTTAPEAACEPIEDVRDLERVPMEPAQIKRDLVDLDAAVNGTAHSELTAMAAIAAQLEPFDEDTRLRMLKWAETWSRAPKRDVCSRG